jgi:hypothetical protein
MQHYLDTLHGKIPLVIQRSANRQRTIAMRLTPAGEVEFLAPQKTPVREILVMAQEKRAWIEKHLVRQQARREQVARDDRTFVWYQGQHLPLRIVHGSRLAVSSLEEGFFTLCLPQRVAVTATTIRRYLKEAMSRETLPVMQQRTTLFAEKLGLVPASVSLSDGRTTWGDCDRLNNIRYNWRTIMLPSLLQDYLAAHELCHIAHKNHSAAFWALVETVMPDYRERRRELRTLSRFIFETESAVAM